MRLLVTADHLAMSQIAARFIADGIATNPQAAIVLATGNTPLETYRQLADLCEQRRVDLSCLRPFQLDEYYGLEAADPRSLYGWSKRAFLDPLGLADEQFTPLRSDLPAMEACTNYDNAVRAAGGFELAVLGLGPNGHLGFNEPPTQADAPTRLVNLTQASLVSNATYWGEGRVPQQALTCGMMHLLAARHVFLLVSGAHKQEILWQTIMGPVTPEVPASFLQRLPQALIVADKAAWPHAEPKEE